MAEGLNAGDFTRPLPTDASTDPCVEPVRQDSIPVFVGGVFVRRQRGGYSRVVVPDEVASAVKASEGTAEVVAHA